VPFIFIFCKISSVIDTICHFSGIDKIIGFALSHQLKNCTNPDPPLSNVQFVLSSESLKHGIDMLESIQSGSKSSTKRKSLKMLSLHMKSVLPLRTLEL